MVLCNIKRPTPTECFVPVYVKIPEIFIIYVKSSETKIKHMKECFVEQGRLNGA